MTQTSNGSVVVAIDVGGTGIKCALADADGRVVHAQRHPTGAARGPQAVVATIGDIAAGLAAKAIADGRTPVAVGVVIPGVVDETRGMAVWAANLGLRDVPIQAQLRERLRQPVTLGHDVRAGALAEARLGAGRDFRRLLFVAVGTGIAGGYVVDGRVDPGAHGAAGEIGHIIVRTGADARPCGCGLGGCLEAHASASAVGRAWHDSQSAQTPDNQTPNQTPSHTAKDVAAAVEAGHPSAVRIWREAVDALADGLLTAIALYDPELIVLGGGLAEAGDTLLTPLRTALTRKATFHRLPTLVRASLGDEAGCLGAALLAWEGVA